MEPVRHADPEIHVIASMAGSAGQVLPLIEIPGDGSPPGRLRTEAGAPAHRQWNRYATPILRFT